MSQSLPERPNLEHLKSQAQELLREFKKGSAKDRVDPIFPQVTRLRLSQAQLIIAREYGFASWAKLKAHVQALAPHLSLEQRADLLAANLIQGSASRAQELIAKHGALADQSIAAACATGSFSTIQSALESNPDWVHSKVGSLQCPPLLYACFSRLLQSPDFKDQITRTIQILLEHGADPNVGFQDGFFASALYGASCVNGDPDLCRMLLDAGATPNDGESVYHSTELPSPDCMRLLLERGGNPEHAIYRMLDFEKPEFVHTFLASVPDHQNLPQAIPHGLRRGRTLDMLRILIESDIDLDKPDGHGQTAYRTALKLGRTDVMNALIANGAKPEIKQSDSILLRLLAGETVSPNEVTPEILAEIDAECPPVLVIWVERDLLGPTEALLKLGANPNGFDHNGFTALHEAAIRGSSEAARLLIRFGANVNQEDKVHHGNALGFAVHVSANPPDPQVYVDLVNLLLDAGADMPSGHNTCKEVLEVLTARGFVSE